MYTWGTVVGATHTSPTADRRCRGGGLAATRLVCPLRFHPSPPPPPLARRRQKHVGYPKPSNYVRPRRRYVRLFTQCARGGRRGKSPLCRRGPLVLTFYSSCRVTSRRPRGVWYHATATAGGPRRFCSGRWPLCRLPRRRYGTRAISVPLAAAVRGGTGRRAGCGACYSRRQKGGRGGGGKGSSTGGPLGPLRPVGGGLGQCQGHAICRPRPVAALADGVPTEGPPRDWWDGVPASPPRWFGRS